MQVSAKGHPWIAFIPGVLKTTSANDGRFGHLSWWLQFDREIEGNEGRENARQEESKMCCTGWCRACCGPAFRLAGQRQAGADIHRDGRSHTNHYGHEQWWSK